MLFQVKEGKTISQRINGVRKRFSGGMLIELTESEAKANAEHILSIEPEIKEKETKIELTFPEKEKKFKKGNKK